MLTYKQAIKLIGYSRKGCYKLIKQGKLKVLKIGKRLFVEESEVEKFLEKKNQDKQPEGYAMHEMGFNNCKKRLLEVLNNGL